MPYVKWPSKNTPVCPTSRPVITEPTSLTSTFFQTVNSRVDNKLFLSPTTSIKLKKISPQFLFHHANLSGTSNLLIMNRNPSMKLLHPMLQAKAYYPSTGLRDYSNFVLRPARTGLEPKKVTDFAKTLQRFFSTQDKTATNFEFTEKESIKNWVDRGNAFFILSRYQEALAAFDKALQVNPKDTRAYHGKGAALVKLNQHEEAIIAFDEALKLDPNNKDAQSIFYNQGLALSHLGHYEKALVAFDKALQLDLEDARAYYCKGTVLGHLNRHEEALTVFDKALAIQLKLLELDPFSQPTLAEAGRTYKNKIVALDKLGRREEGSVAQKDALHLYTHCAKAYYARSITLNDQGHYQEALKDYNIAVALDPQILSQASTHIMRGIMLGNLCRYQEALVSLDRALELNPKDAKAYHNKGLILGNLGHHEKALMVFNHALQFNDQHAETYFKKGLALANLGHYEEALAACDKAITLQPSVTTDMAEAYNIKGIVLGQLGRYEEALLSYDKALQCNPSYSEVYLNKGNLFDVLGRCEEALLSYDKALQLNPDGIKSYLKREEKKVFNCKELSLWVKTKAKFFNAVDQQQNNAQNNVEKRDMKTMPTI